MIRNDRPNLPTSRQRRRTVIHSLAAVLLFALTILLLTSPPHVWAGSITVNSLVDGVDLPALAGNGTCDLREAIIAANTDAPVDSCTEGSGADIIYLDTLSGTISLLNNLPAVTTDIQFVGPGSANLTIDGAANYRSGFEVVTTTVVIQGLTLANGTETLGGAIYNNGGTVSVLNAALDNNLALNSGGAVYNFNGGIMDFDGVSMDQNQALVNGGHIWNQGPGLAGNPGVLFQNGAITGYIGQPNVFDSAVDGGGIYNTGSGTITVNNSLINLHRVNGSGSGIFSNSTGAVTITGGTQIVGNEAVVGGGGGVYALNGLVSLNGSTLLGNSAGTSGGGIFYENGAGLTIQSSNIVTNNAGNNGAGILNNNSPLTLAADVTVSGNIASGFGGGLYNDGGSSTSITQSVFSGNEASNGAGIYQAGAGTLNMLNSTLSGNTALGVSGGGLEAAGGSTTLTHVTVAFNNAITTGGGIYATASVNLRNTIIADNTVFSAGGPDCEGTLNAASAANTNLVRDTLLCTVNGAPVRTGAADLSVLGYYGGATQVHALFSSSQAVDSGDAAVCGSIATDQRGAGYPRTQGAVCDIGAYEYDGYTDLGVMVVDAPDPVEPGQTYTYTITITNYGPQGTSDITFEMLLPAPFTPTFVSYSNPSGLFSCFEGSGTITCSFSGEVFDAGLSDVIILTFTAPPSNGVITVSGSVQILFPPPSDPNPVNNTFVVDTTVGLPTSTPEDTAVPVDTDTPIPTDTDTPVPTDTPMPTDTPQTVTTPPTSEPAENPTDTPVPAQADTPTYTPTPTDTPVTPGEAPTATDTPTPIPAPDGRGCRIVPREEIPLDVQEAFAKQADDYIAPLWLICDEPPPSVILPYDAESRITFETLERARLLDCSASGRCRAFRQVELQVDDVAYYAATGRQPYCLEGCAFAGLVAPSTGQVILTISIILALIGLLLWLLFILLIRRERDEKEEELDEDITTTGQGGTP